MKKNDWVKHADFLILDLICLILSFAAAYFLRHKNFDFISISIYRDMFFVIIVFDLIVFFLYDPFRYVVRRGRFSELKITFYFDLISFIAAVIYLVAIKAAGDYSRLTLVYTYLIYFVSSYLVRIYWKRRIRIKSYNAINNGDKSLLIICKKEDIEYTINGIKESNYDFYYISAICVTDDNEYKNNDRTILRLDNVLEYVSTNWVDDIFVATDFNSIPEEIINGFVSTGIPIHVKLDAIAIFGNRPQVIDKLGSFNTITSVKNHYNGTEMLIKRLIDIIGGLVGCLITLILIVVIGPIIYFKSPGNIFYVSQRVGKNGKLFKFYKFRSMRLDADELKESLQEQNISQDGMMFKIEDDPRIIPGIGNFIRKTSLDEFPQFFNVLKGDMSLVGTRPPTLDEWNKYSPYYRSRMSIKPGITGLWQVSGRSNITDFDEVVKLDNDYINNWSLGLDFKILLKTIELLFNRKENGAY